MPNNKYKKLYLTEADDMVQKLNNALLGLEKNPSDVQLANDAMRASHTLKSSSAAMEYMHISHLSHAMEDFFEGVRTNHHALSQDDVNLLFKSVDAIVSSLRAIKSDSEENNTEGLVKQLRDLGNKEDDEETDSRQKTNTSPFSEASGENHKSFDPITSIKVDVETLDNLMNLTEELLVNRLRFNEIERDLEEEGKEAKKVNEAELRAAIQDNARLVNELQYLVTDSRLVPLGQIFERFPRMVRDLSKEHNKNVEYTMAGKDIELDRTVIDRIGEPLIHLLRNAIDHGVGERGLIQVRAFRKQDKVIIEVENDGNAIDWEKVIISSVRRGIIDQEKEKDLRYKISDLELKNEDGKDPKILHHKSEILDLIFHPQLSTKEKVTETSGRGIGLSIVKTVIESLGGDVKVQSPTDSGGTKFILELPLTLAIIQALLVRSSTQVFALPFVQVERTVRITQKDIKKVFDQEVAVVDEKEVPMVRLNKIFDLASTKDEFAHPNASQGEPLTGVAKETINPVSELMIITTGENMPRAGIIIDDLIAEQDIVVKPLKGITRSTKGFAGITLLGDGKPALILDVATII